MMEVIVMILPRPSPAGGTRRTSKQFKFDVDLSDFFLELKKIECFTKFLERSCCHST